jgi:hypothetical protein
VQVKPCAREIRAARFGIAENFVRGGQADHPGAQCSEHNMEKIYDGVGCA